MPGSQGDTTYQETVKHFRELVSTQSLPFPVAAFASLLEHARHSQALTISELTHSLSEASTYLRLAVSGSWPLEAGCMLFKRFFATVTANSVDLEVGRRDLLRRGDQYVATACAARETIAGLAANFIKDDTVKKGREGKERIDYPRHSEPFISSPSILFFFLRGDRPSSFTRTLE